MYLLGVQLGNYLFFGNGEHSSTMLRSNRWARIRVWVLALLFWYGLNNACNFYHPFQQHFKSDFLTLSLNSCFRIITLLLDRYVERVSRRMV
jgi:hypothetical protein